MSLLVVPGNATRLLLDLVARLARRMALRVLDGGNCFNVYIVAREIARHTQDVEAALQRVQAARAFTCYQVLSLLEDTPADGRPTLVLNMLDTFYDESVPLRERERLLSLCLMELQRLNQSTSVGISARLPKVDLPDAMGLLRTLESAVDQVWRFEPEAPAPPLRLF